MAREYSFIGKAVLTFDPPPGYSPGAGDPRPLPVQQIVYGAQRPIWPDVDARYDVASASWFPGKYRGYVVEKPGIRALCLGPETDWDAVYVYPKGSNDPLLLAPGIVLRFPKAIGGYRVEPVVQPPATRLSGARGLDTSERLPRLDEGQKWVVTGTGSIKNVGDGPVTTYGWDGTKWVAPLLPPNPTETAVNANLQAYSPVDLTNVDVKAYAQAQPRPADYSPNGRDSFADLIKAGVILTDVTEVPYNGDLYVSVEPVDSNGNPGDATDPTTEVFKSAYTVPLDARFYGRLHMEEWIDEDPGCSYAPMRPPERALHLVAVGVGNSALVLDGVSRADEAVLTVPALNVESAQWLARAVVGPAGLLLELGNPHPYELISDACNVRAGDQPAKAALGKFGAAALFSNVGPYIQCIAAGDGDGSVVEQGSILVLRRKFVG